MAVAIDKCNARVRLRDTHADDVKVTKIKEEKEKKKTYVYCIWRCSQAKI